MMQSEKAWQIGFVKRMVLKYTKFRTISALSKGEAPGPEASITKIVSANKLQAIGNFGIDSGDMAGMLIDDENGMSLISRCMARRSWVEDCWWNR